MDRNEELVELMGFESAQAWSERLCLCVAGENTFALKFFSRASTDDAWAFVNDSEDDFAIMDWWQALQVRLKEGGAPKFGCGTAKVTSTGDLEVLLLDYAVDPLAGFDAMAIVDVVADRGTELAEFGLGAPVNGDVPTNEDAKADSAEPHVRSDAPGFSKEECLQCIWDCLTESLPDNWKTAQMMVEIKGAEANANYTYTAGLIPKKVKFRTSNVFAPINAAVAIQDMMAAQGQGWSGAVFELRRNGNMQIKPKS